MHYDSSHMEMVLDEVLQYRQIIVQPLPGCMHHGYTHPAKSDHACEIDNPQCQFGDKSQNRDTAEQPGSSKENQGPENENGKQCGGADGKMSEPALPALALFFHSEEYAQEGTERGEKADQLLFPSLRPSFCPSHSLTPLLPLLPLLPRETLSRILDVYA